MHAPMCQFVSPANGFCSHTTTRPLHMDCCQFFPLIITTVQTNATGTFRVPMPVHLTMHLCSCHCKLWSPPAAHACCRSVSGCACAAAALPHLLRQAGRGALLLPAVQRAEVLLPALPQPRHQPPGCHLRSPLGQGCHALLRPARPHRRPAQAGMHQHPALCATPSLQPCLRFIGRCTSWGYCTAHGIQKNVLEHDQDKLMRHLIAGIVLTPSHEMKCCYDHLICMAVYMLQLKYCICSSPAPPFCASDVEDPLTHAQTQVDEQDSMAALLGA